MQLVNPTAAALLDHVSPVWLVLGALLSAATAFDLLTRAAAMARQNIGGPPYTQLRTVSDVAPFALRFALANGRTIGLLAVAEIAGNLLQRLTSPVQALALPLAVVAQIYGSAQVVAWAVGNRNLGDNLWASRRQIAALIVSCAAFSLALHFIPDIPTSSAAAVSAAGKDMNTGSSFVAFGVGILVLILITRLASWLAAVSTGFAIQPMPAKELFRRSLDLSGPHLIALPRLWAYSWCLFLPLRFLSEDLSSAFTDVAASIACATLGALMWQGSDTLAARTPAASSNEVKTASPHGP